MIKPQLRDYQLDVQTKAKEAFKEGYKSVMAVVATGGGKTVIFSDLAEQVARMNRRVWILTHREEIRLQTVKKLTEFGLVPGQIASGYPITRNNIQVASVQTLVNRLEVFDQMGLKPDFLITDECHHSPASTWKTIINYWDNVKHLGVTATPQRTDGVGLNEVYDVMIQGPQTAELVARGFLCEPVVMSSPLTVELSSKKLRIKNNEYDKDEQSNMMSEKRIVNDTVDMYNKFFNGAPIVIFCCSVEDCELVASAMRNQNWVCEVVKSGMDSEERKSHIEGLGNGKVNAVCSYDVISEGVDVPILAGCIMRRRTNSLTTYLQQAGRTLRLYEGKKQALIIDQCGNIFIHGHPLEIREWDLYSKKRKPKKDADDEIEVTQCPSCYVVLSGKPSVCSICGHVFNSKVDMQSSKNIDQIYADMQIIRGPQISEISTTISDILSYSPENRDDVIIDKIIADASSGDSVDTVQERLNALAAAFGKNSKWASHVWNKYIKTEVR